MKKLLADLNEQKDLYKILLEKAHSKQEAIIKNNLQTIENLNKEEEKIIADIAAIENRRIQYIENNPGIFGEDAMKLTMEELKDRFPEEIRQDFNSDIAKLMEILKELKTVNSENSELLKQALRIVNVTINTITGADDSSGYGKDKNQAGNKTRNLFDRKI